MTPDQVAVSEDQQLRQFTQEERDRYEFTLRRNQADMYEAKYAHQTGYHHRLQDNIDLLNQ